MSTNPNGSSLFSAFTSGANDMSNPDTQIDKKLQQRQEQFSSEANFSQIKENAISSDLTLGSDERAKMFRMRRIQAKLNIESPISLKEKLTIPLQLYDECSKLEVLPNELQLYMQHFASQDIAIKYKGIVGLRKLISAPTNPPIQEMIDYGLVGEFIALLDSQYPEFQYEALFCLINIACGTTDQANSIIVRGGVSKIINLMGSRIEEIQDQAIWTLGNLAGDSEKVRDQIIQQGGYEKLIVIFSTAERPQLIKRCTWTIGNFCRVKPPMPYELLKKSLDYLIKGINKLGNDQEFMTDACWILSFLTENFKKSIKVIMETNALPIVFECLKVNVVFIQLSCLRIIGNIASGNANQTQQLLDWGLLPYLKQTIIHPKKTIRKETAWIISNIAAGTQRQIESLITDNFLPILIEVIKKDEPEIRKEAIWAVCNLTSIEKKELMEQIIKQQIVETIFSCLSFKEAKILAVSLEALGNLLAFGKQYYTVNGVNEIVKKAEELGMFEVLEQLEYHPVEIVYEKVIKLLETYFDVENTA